MFFLQVLFTQDWQIVCKIGNELPAISETYLWMACMCFPQKVLFSWSVCRLKWQNLILVAVAALIRLTVAAVIVTDSQDLGTCVSVLHIILHLQIYLWCLHAILCNTVKPIKANKHCVLQSTQHLPPVKENNTMV